MDLRSFFERLSVWAGTVSFIKALYYVPSIAEQIEDPGLESNLIMVVEPGHDHRELPELFKAFFGDELAMALEIPDGSWHAKVLLYFESILENSFPIIDIRIDVGTIEDLDPSNARIPLFEQSREPETQSLLSNDELKKDSIQEFIKTKVSNLIARFVRLEIFHFHSDLIGYLAEYFSLLIGTLQLQGNVAGKIPLSRNSRHLFNSVLNESEQQFFTRTLLESARHLSNESRQGYIDWLSFVIEGVQEKFGAEALPAPLETITRFLERIYEKYYLRVFRRVQGTSNVYRSLAPAEYKSDPRLEKWFVEHDIKTIIDIRRPDEIEKDPDDEELANRLGLIIYAISFNADEINAHAYTKGLIGCEAEIKQIFETILASPRSTLIHCVSGKDRTGIIAALIELLLGVPDDVIIEAYLLSGQDTRDDRIEQSIAYINKQGGIRNFLALCGFPEELQEQLIEKIKRTV